MNYLDKIEFEKQCELAYKPVMQKLILEWKDKYDASIIKECFYFWVVKHNHQKTLDLVNRRKHRKLKFKQMKDKLETLEVKNKLDTFVEEL